MIAYVKYKIYNIFYAIQTWAQAYIDNIVYRIKLLPNLFDKLQTLFEIFLTYNISISPIKSYLNYANRVLLGQWVDFLGLTTSKQKLKAIKLLTYLNILGALEYYPDLISYLESYIYFYMQLTASFQALKTTFFW